MNSEQLRAAFEGAGWRIDRNPMLGEGNECDWYAWMSQRPTGWPDCEYNNKPPSLIAWPFLGRRPDGRGVDGVTFEVTGETHGRWLKLQMYTVRPDEAVQAANEAVIMLGAAWIGAAHAAHGKEGA